MIRAFLDGGWLVVTEFDDHPDFFQVMQDQRATHLPRRARGADQHARAGGGAAPAQPGGRGVPQRDGRVAGDPQFRRSRACLTVFFGALNREQDWEPLMGAINAVAARAGERLRFSVVHDQRLLRCAGDAAQAIHRRLCDYDTYMDLLGDCEVSLMPLADNGFNRAKSDLKFIEAGACRVAALASDVVYGDTIEEGRTGLLFRDAAELQEKLLRLVAMPESGPRPGRCGARLRGAEPHAGLPGRAADRLVPLAVGPPRGADRGAGRAAGRGARTGDAGRISASKARHGTPQQKEAAMAAQPISGSSQAKPTVALMLQGGGALGAYHIGAYQALAEHDLHPDWVAGISIGAINAAVVAGNPPGRTNRSSDRVVGGDFVARPAGTAGTDRAANAAQHGQHRRGGVVRAAELLHPAPGQPVFAPTRAAAGGELLRHLSDARDPAPVRRLHADQRPRGAAEPGRDGNHHRRPAVLRQPPAAHRAGACAGQRLAAAGTSGDAGAGKAVLGRRLRLQLAAGCGGGRAGPAASGRVSDRPVGCRRAAAGNNDRCAVAREADPVRQPHGASRR